VFAGEYGAYAVLVRPDRLLSGVFFAWVGNWTWWSGLAGVAASLLVFPDGHLRSRRWRLPAGALGLGVALTVVGDALMPGPMRLTPGTNPFGLPGLTQVLDAARSGEAAAGSPHSARPAGADPCPTHCRRAPAGARR
jgi:hypothetical protein